MKKIIILLILWLILYFWYTELYQKYFIVFEWKTIKKDLDREDTKLLVSSWAKLIWDIKLKSWEIIFENNSSFSWNIILESGKIIIKDNVVINWDINFSWNIIIWKNSKINWNINQSANLFKDSSAFISWEKPKLFVTTDYPDFLRYFDSLPDSHKKEFGYIFLTSSNMDIRWKDLKPEEYFKWIYFYKDNKLQSFDFSDKIELNKFYKNAKKYIDLLPERKVGRFWVWFTTKNYAFDKKHADIYISSIYADPVLFTHEYGHVMDYAYWFIDIHNPSYPYLKKENSITEYWKFHKWEDFAEAYRYYILHSNSFRKMTKDNNEIKQKYNYMKRYVFNNLEY